MAKIHFNVNGRSACGRGARIGDGVFQVNCLACTKRPEYIKAKALADADKAAAFFAQEPHPVKEPWREGNMVCRECGGTLFREADRSCYGHYSNHECANCGHNESRLTETGMSF